MNAREAQPVSNDGRPDIPFGCPTKGETMRRSILTMVVAAVAFFALVGSASAHVAQGAVVCQGVTVSWAHFPGGPFDMNLAFADQAGGKAVASPYVVVHLNGASGTQFIAAPAANGVTFRKVVGTWTADGGGSFTATATVKPCNCKPTTTTPTTTTTTTPGQTVTVTTPGQTVTVVKTVTTPGSTVTVTTPGPTNTVTVAGPTVTTTTPGAVVIKRKTKTVVRWRNRAIIVRCPPGWNGSYLMPMNPKKPIVTHCGRHVGVEGAGVTG